MGEAGGKGNVRFRVKAHIPTRNVRQPSQSGYTGELLDHGPNDTGRLWPVAAIRPGLSKALLGESR